MDAYVITYALAPDEVAEPPRMAERSLAVGGEDDDIDEEGTNDGDEASAHALLVGARGPTTAADKKRVTNPQELKGVATTRTSGHRVKITPGVEESGLSPDAVETLGLR